MKTPTDDEIARYLVGIITDGFNRSLQALSDAGAVSTKVMREHYNGVGSKYHDLVTEQIALTAGYAVPAIRDLFTERGVGCDRVADA